MRFSDGDKQIIEVRILPAKANQFADSPASVGQHQSDGLKAPLTICLGFPVSEGSNIGRCVKQTGLSPQPSYERFGDGSKQGFICSQDF